MGLIGGSEHKSGLSGLIQIKVFTSHTSNDGEIEKQVNDFLIAKMGEIEVLDIKYTSNDVNPNNGAWHNWSVMIIYKQL